MNFLTSLLSLVMDKFMRLIWEKVDAPDKAIDAKPVPDSYRNHWDKLMHDNKDRVSSSRGINKTRT